MSTLNEMCCIYLFLCQALKKGDILSDCLPLIMAQFQNLVVLCVVITGFIRILSNIMKLYIKTIHKESCTEGMFKVLPLHNRFPHTTWVWLFMFRVDLLFGLWILSSHSKQRFMMRSFSCVICTGWPCKKEDLSNFMVSYEYLLKHQLQAESPFSHFVSSSLD